MGKKTSLLLGLKPGDRIKIIIENNTVYLRKAEVIERIFEGIEKRASKRS